jgi:hypothetical protein
MGSIPGGLTGDGRFDGETFLGGLLIFFLGGEGEGKRNSRVRLAERLSQDGRAPNSPVYVIYYLLSSGGFAAHVFRPSRKGAPRSSDTLGRRVRCFRSRHPVDLFKL